MCAACAQHLEFGEALGNLRAPSGTRCLPRESSALGGGSFSGAWPAGCSQSDTCPDGGAPAAQTCGSVGVRPPSLRSLRSWRPPRQRPAPPPAWPSCGLSPCGENDGATSQITMRAEAQAGPLVWSWDPPGPALQQTCRLGWLSLSPLPTQRYGRLREACARAPTVGTQLHGADLRGASVSCVRGAGAWCFMRRWDYERR